MKKDNILLLALPGIILSLLISFLAYKISNYHPLLDAFFVAFIIAIIIGRLLKKVSFTLWIGTALCKDILIPLGLFLYGTQINWIKWLKLDPIVFIISFVNIFIYFVIIFLCNRYIFHITNNKFAYLNGGANSICGVSATAVFIPFVDAKEDEISATLLAIVIVGLISVFSTWYIVHNFMNFSMEQYAALCGVTLNQTGAVKVAGNFMSKEACNLAVTIKFFRTSLIPFVAFFIMFLNFIAGGTAPKMSKGLRISATKYGIFIGSLFFFGSFLSTFTPLQAHSKLLDPWFKVIFGMTLVSVGLLCNIDRILKKETFLNVISALIGWIIVVIASTILIKVFV